MMPLFLSDSLQKEFERNGFVKVDLLSKMEVDALLISYKSVLSEHEKINIPYITTSHSNNSDLISKVDSLLQKVIAPAISKIMCNYKLLFGNYLVKMPIANSETDPHQDITFVDEKEFASVNIWVALQDTNEENGCLYILKGSHKLMHTLRPSQNYPWAYENAKEEIKRLATPFQAKAGQAFVFNHAVVHGSYPNKTNRARIAAVLAAYPDKADLLHYYLPTTENNLVSKYLMTKQAYLHFKKGEPPAMGILLEKVNFDFKQISKTEFERLWQRRTGSTSFLNQALKFLKRR